MGRDANGRWTGGTSGNPAGRSKTARRLSELLFEALQKEGPDGRTKAEALAEKIIDLAIAGDVAAFKIVIDRLEGRVPLRLDLYAEISHEAHDPDLPAMLEALGYRRVDDVLARPAAATVAAPELAAIAGDGAPEPPGLADPFDPDPDVIPMGVVA